MQYDVVLLRSQDIISDTRVLRQEVVFKKNNIKYLIIGWDRVCMGVVRDNTEYCRSRAGFQQGAKGIWGRIKFNFFLLKWLLKHIECYRCIHACDLDTVIPALFMKIFGKVVIFDIFDWYSDEIHTSYKWLNLFINYLERFSVKLADLVIICEKNRIKQMGITPSRYLIIRNMTRIKPYNIKKILPPLSVVYVGGLVEHRGLRELVEIAGKYFEIKVHIAGFGDEKITQIIKQADIYYSNIFYYGKLDYITALELMGAGDLLYAMYYTSNANHIYAAPNKFYESLLLNKPILTNTGTLMSDIVAKYNTGYVINEGKDALEKFFMWWMDNADKVCDINFTHLYEQISIQQKESLIKYVTFVKSI